MLLSIVVPVYNAKKYLDESLRSIEVCSSNYIEVILVDDGSRDSSAKICDDWQKKDSRFHAYHIPNGGVSNARNYGMKQCSGNRIMFLDADDYIDKTEWDFILDKALNDDSDFVAFAYYTLFDDGKIKDELFEFDGEHVSDVNSANRIMYASSRLNACWAKLFKRSIIEECGLEFEKGVAIGEDAAFVTEYFSRCKTYSFYNKKMLYYRQHEASAMKHYDIKDRLSYTYPLYELAYRKLDEISKDKLDDKLMDEVAVYYLRVLTNLYREYAQRESGKTLSDTYKILLEDSWANKVLANLEGVGLSRLKGLEYKLIKRGSVAMLKFYFKTKARIS